MGALGLTRGRVGLGTNVYANLMGGLPPARTRSEIVHAVSASKVKPVKDLGTDAVEISVILLVSSSGLPALWADLEVTSSRKFSFLLGDALEVYYFVNGAKNVSLSQHYPGEATYWYEVSATFTAGDTRLYKASDDSVLLGV